MDHQLWTLVVLQPLELQGCRVSHLKINLLIKESYENFKLFYLRLKILLLRKESSFCRGMNTYVMDTELVYEKSKKSRNKCKKIECTCCIRAAQDTPAMVAKRIPIAMFIFLLKLWVLIFKDINLMNDIWAMKKGPIMVWTSKVKENVMQLIGLRAEMKKDNYIYLVM